LGFRLKGRLRASASRLRALAWLSAFGFGLWVGAFRYSTLAAQAIAHAHPIPVVPAELLNRPLPLRGNIGRAHDAVSTVSKEAQAYYDQGLAYLHGYVWIEAARSFNQALRLDPRLAIADAELSIAYTELNQPALARSALERARALASQASEHDRLHITARVGQAEAEAAPGDQTKLAAYRKALDAALLTAPQDVELLILRGIGESPDPADRGQGSVLSSIPSYEKALRLGSVAAHHYLTHALENSGRIADALPHADAYARAAPAIPHALHMSGHVLRRLGKIDEAVGAFEAAERAEAEYLRAEKIPPEYDWHGEHNLDLLGSSYRYLGQIAKAERELKTAFDLPSSLIVQMYNKRAWPEFLIARGRTDDALAAARVLTAHSVTLVRAVGHIEAGHARLASGNMQAAADESNAALMELRSASGGQALIAPALQELQGQYLLRTGERDRAHAMLEDLVKKIRALPGPDNWVQALFTMEVIGQTARDSGDWIFAEWIGRQMVEHDPNYAGGHYALALNADHRDDVSNAQAEFATAARLWSRADPSLPELARIRERVTNFGVR
jgi:tetratricopeptide (TPR) repeat protein